jgi:alginate O-acetyltransferase complex protein AlgI
MIQDVAFWLALLAVVPAFWILPGGYRQYFLSAFSLVGLASYDPLSATILLVQSSLVYLLCPKLVRGRTAWLLVAIAGLAAPLILFKAHFASYLTFLGRPQSFGDVLVPLGMSYYVFRLLHVAIDAYRREEFPYSLRDYVSYVFLFPILPAGPIQRLDEFKQRMSTEFTPDHLLYGGTRIVYGLVKQTFLINVILFARDKYASKPVEAINVEMLQTIPYSDLWLILVAAYLTSLLNLSAYTDIAIGASRLFGYTISENFRFPFVAWSLPEFWRRWHITLSNWCQVYVYAPMLGWTRNPYMATIVSFQVMGLWHVFSVNRILWGLFHALGVIGTILWARYLRRPLGSGTFSPAVAILGWGVTQAFVSASWIFVLTEQDNDVVGSLKVLFRLVSG